VYGLVLSLAVAGATPLACRDFGGNQSPDRGGASGNLSGGQPATTPQGGELPMGGGEPSSVAGAGGDVNGAGRPSELAAAGLGGAALPEVSEGGAAGGGGEPVPPQAELLPTDFPGLVLWLDASEETCTIDEDDYISKVRDRSGLGNDALEHSPFARPKYSWSEPLAHGALTFEPVVRPNGDQPSSLRVPDSQALAFGTDNFAYVLVMRWDNTQTVRVNNASPPAALYSGSGGILSKQNGFSPYGGVFLMANLPSPYLPNDADTVLAVQLSLAGPRAHSYQDGLNDSVFRVCTLRRDKTDLALRINGEREGGTVLKPSVDVSAQGADLLLGGVGGQPLRGDIAEVVALRGGFSDAELLALERQLLKKYALE